MPPGGSGGFTRTTVGVSCDIDRPARGSRPRAEPGRPAGIAGRVSRGQAVLACPLFLSVGVAEAPGSRAAVGGRVAT